MPDPVGGTVGQFMSTLSTPHIVRKTKNMQMKIIIESVILKIALSMVNSLNFDLIQPFVKVLGKIEW